MGIGEAYIKVKTMYFIKCQVDFSLKELLYSNKLSSLLIK